jgi:hypothetical protein
VIDTDTGLVREATVEWLPVAGVTREIDRMDDPSQSMERIWTRLCRGSLFMPLTYALML